MLQRGFNALEISGDKRPEDVVEWAEGEKEQSWEAGGEEEGAEIPPKNHRTPAGAAPPKIKTRARPAPPVGEVSTERLSVFEDFLGKLDLDELDKKDKPDDDKPDKPKPDKPDKPKPDKPDKPKKPRKK